MTRPPLHDRPGAFGGLDAPLSLEAARFAVLPIPYDGTSTWQKGADRGPEALLEASANMELYDIETGLEPWRDGIVTLAPLTGYATPEAMAEGVREAASTLLDDERVLVGLGGEHSVSIGLIRAHAGRYPGLSVLQLDAHADTRESYEGSRCNHACVMARAREVADVVAVGIRSLDASERDGLAPERTFFAHAYDPQADPETVTDRLGDPVYVTIDLDVLDPSEMPATGTPEPGGLRYREVTRLLDAVCRRRRVVGFDVVELMPLKENRAPDFLAARLVYQLMAFISRGRGGTPE